MKNSLAEYLTDHKKSNPISFHMPGHKSNYTILKKLGYENFLSNIIGNDITEIPGADILSKPTGRIKKLMEGYADIYGAKSTILLVNGSSTGVVASILYAAQKSKKIIISKNAHKSVFSGIRLANISPVYIEPNIDENTGFEGEITKESVIMAINENKEAEAIFITSPNYYGVVSDVKEIAKIAHEAGKILIVDQAHGAHLKFFDNLDSTCKSAENAGADIVINSIHKTLFGFTSTAIVNICSDNIDISRLNDIISMIQTSSPSYILLGSLDMNFEIIKNHGAYLINKWKENIIYFYEKAKKIQGISMVINKDGDYGKISISSAALGISGKELERRLIKNNIFPEMIFGDYVLLMTGIGGERRDYIELLNILKEVSESYGVVKESRIKSTGFPIFRFEQAEIPAESEEIPLYKAEGRICYEPIVAFPPGTPLICPGEIINDSLIKYLYKIGEIGISIIGIDDEGRIKVGSKIRH